MAYTNFPNSAVCYILADIPGEGEFQATGVIIGPHTILTASHLLWDADVGQGADAVSIYPGYVPNGSDYNPSGALGGTQAIHYITIPDQNGELSAKGTQHDFAVIDTSTDLSQYGHFALNFGFKRGDTDLFGYPASNNGNQTGTGGVISADRLYSDLDTGSLAISPGDSGGPIFNEISNRSGRVVPGVTGIVSTGDYACKITRRKVGIIRNWVQSDSSLWTGQGSPAGAIVPQISGTVDSATLAASLAPQAGETEDAGGATAVNGDFATMVDVLNRTRAEGSEGRFSSSGAESAFGWAGAHGSDAFNHHHHRSFVAA